jgi:serine/threonine-protein kinase
MQRLGPYTILEPLGRGAMGAVYRARDEQAGRLVALKVPILSAESKNRLPRLIREGQAAAALDHPGIVRVHAMGQAGGVPFLACELVEGARTLGELVDGWEPRRRVEAVRDVARALGHAHARGVIHRDVKEENVLVDAAGHVRVADFGLARLADVERLTMTGVMLGTPRAMAPEQVRGDPDGIGPHTDVWAVGVLLYRALTGRHPFEGGTIVELGRAIITADPPRPGELAEVEPPFESVCLRALSSNPNERYPDGEAMARALDAALGEAPTRARRAPALLLAAASLALIGGVLALGWAATRPGPSGDPDLGASAGDDGGAPTDPIPTGTSGAPPVDSPSGADAPPPWFAALESPPSLPLPRGVTWTDAPGEFHNARDGSTLVWVPPTLFQMGHPDGIGPPAEQGEHYVELTRGFFLGKHEVTAAQFEAFLTATGHQRTLSQEMMAPKPPGPDFPAVFLSWHDANAYCAWAEGALPTEAQWELAATGGDKRTFPWGEEEDPDRARWGGTHARPAPVGSYPSGASPYGCLDMAGNVWEWVHDHNAPYPRERLVDPTGPVEGFERLARGGCFETKRPICRTSKRAAYSPKAVGPNLGFRLAVHHR